MRGLSLHTVCEEARCPNIWECWENRTATFMILGDVCTRACRFCAVTSGRPGGLDLEEPLRVAQAVQRLGLQHIVVTSVARDDVPDGGSSIFAASIRQIRRLNPQCRVEVLIPDFSGNEASQSIVFDAHPDILNHNIETVERLQRTVRSKFTYERSMELLHRASNRGQANGMLIKSGMMVGLGEEWNEILQTMADLRSVGVDIFTIGQYLRPSKKHIPLARYYTPQEFAQLKVEAQKLGYRHVESGPLVRSSYHAHKQL